MADMMEHVREIDITLDDGRVLHAYDTGGDSADTRVPVIWHHGTPNIGAPPTPLSAAAARSGLRWVSYDRPGYGGSSSHPGRGIASAAADVGAIADALGIGRFGVLGHSGGGPHALACAAMLGDRVFAAVSVSGVRPYPVGPEDERAWYAGMHPAGEAEFRAAYAGREALAALFAKGEFDPGIFTPEDHAALGGDWKWLASMVGPAIEDGPDAMIDDDLAYTAAWGFDPGTITVPVLLMHGEADRMVPASHSQWLANHIPGAELRVCPGEGHVSVLRQVAAGVTWLGERAPAAP
jgi:pimeloyl-ACP methyl ester carboxylesterase